MKKPKLKIDNIGWKEGIGSYTSIFVVYFLICIVLFSICIPSFNRLSRHHDLVLASEMGSLVAEKVNDSIKYISISARTSADLLGAHDIMDMDTLYYEIQSGLDDAPYESIGLINPRGHIYSSFNEISEFNKWNLTELAVEDKEVRFSNPYRSSSSGKMVITIMTGIFKNDQYIGSLFITYPLEEIQEMAQSDAIDGIGEIYLMNAQTENYIVCASGDSRKNSSWNNMKSIYNRISDVESGGYDEWRSKMKNSEETASVNFYFNNSMYTQVFRKVDAMENWYVVVRMQSSELSSTLDILRYMSYLMVAVLIIGTGILFVILRRKEGRERDKLQNISTHDVLTGMLNRRAFEDMVSAYLMKEPGNKNAMIFSDIDHFKSINDTYGHETGDKALCAYADALTRIFSGSGIVARLGGDEFVVLVQNIESNGWLEERMQMLRYELDAVKLTNSEGELIKDIKLHYSAGIARYPEHARTLEVLLKCADDALYSAKENGRNRYRWFEESDSKKKQRALEMSISKEQARSVIWDKKTEQ